MIIMMRRGGGEAKWSKKTQAMTTMKMKIIVLVIAEHSIQFVDIIIALMTSFVYNDRHKFSNK